MDDRTLNDGRYHKWLIAEVTLSSTSLASKVFDGDVGQELIVASLAWEGHLP